MKVFWFVLGGGGFWGDVFLLRLLRFFIKSKRVFYVLLRVVFRLCF